MNTSPRLDSWPPNPIKNPEENGKRLAEQKEKEAKKAQGKKGGSYE